MMWLDSLKNFDFICLKIFCAIKKCARLWRFVFEQMVGVAVAQVWVAVCIEIRVVGYE